MGHGQVVHFDSGAVIFRQGEHGGDLYFIRSGEVEIFVERDGKSIVLDRLKTGEVLGTMTILNRDPRMASARAVTACEAVKVSGDNVAKLVATLPDWLKTVLKDYTLRIAHMDRAFVDASIEKDELKSIARTPLSVVRSVASGFISLVALSEKEMETPKALKVIADILGVPLNEVSEAADFLQKSGFLGDDGMKLIKPTIIDDLKYFLDNAPDGKSKKKKSAAYLPPADQRVLLALCSFAKQTITDEKEGRFLLKELCEGVEKLCHRKVEVEILERADGVGILKFDRSAEPHAVVFSPRDLARRVGVMAIIRKFELKESGDQ
jgi:CRP/FNR family cyclic AMP-dependent transcriptional regulator